MVNIAKLNQKLIYEFDYNSTGTTSTGEYVPNWQYYRTVYGSITQQRGTINLDSTVGNVDYKDVITFYLMYNKDLTSKKGFRVRYQDRYYTVNQVTVVPFNQAIILDLTAAII